MLFMLRRAGWLLLFLTLTPECKGGPSEEQLASEKTAWAKPAAPPAAKPAASTRPAPLPAPARSETLLPVTPAPPVTSNKRTSKIEHIFVIALENHDALQIYGNNVDAPYINQVANQYARVENFIDTLALDVPSAPHYVWMEAGTNRFSDATFDDNHSPSAATSTGSKQHLAAQIELAKNGLSWLSYQEGLNAATGLCPISVSGFYAPKHNPFVYFRDVVGDPPAKDNPYCIKHHKPLSALAEDLGKNSVATYNFITPDQCHDMHGYPGCPAEDPIRTGDNWLKGALPPLIAFANAHASVIFLVWDEGDTTLKLPFIALGPMIKPHHVSPGPYTHSSLLKSIELSLGLPVLPSVADATDLSDLFRPGSFP
jgi:phosphatidylinositol-3-phosphatase